MHLDNHSLDAELGREASLTLQAISLAMSVRFNYPYLKSLNNCKCYCWSQELSRPLKTPRHFPDSAFHKQGNNGVNVTRPTTIQTLGRCVTF